MSVDSTLPDHAKNFKKGDMIYVRHENDGLYEAKILSIDKSKKAEIRFKIHYKGWSKNFDEWKTFHALFPVNHINTLIFERDDEQRKKKRNQDRKKDRRKRKRSADANEDRVPAPKRKRLNNGKAKSVQSNSVTASSVAAASEPAKKTSTKPTVIEPEVFDIAIPTDLKHLLVRDWEMYTKHKKAIELPRPKGERIVDILSEFANAYGKGKQSQKKQRKAKTKATQQAADIADGIGHYFDQALQVTLLYPVERPIHEKMVASLQEPLRCSEIYGVEHLCRLFIKLPQLLKPDELKPDTRKILMAKIGEIMEFILESKERFFAQQYFPFNEKDGTIKTN